MNDNNTCHYFIPVVREGLATLIREAATGHRAKLNVVLTATAVKKGSTDVDPKSLDLLSIGIYGPSDVLGFDERIVVRTVPKPDVGDFESNYFPAIEFADFDFAWRFTADKVVEEGALKGKLQPWIALVVLISEARGDDIKPEFDEVQPVDSDLPRSIEVKSSLLPNLDEYWRWAHVHITAEDGLTEESDKPLHELLRTEPEFAVCSLLCPRRLVPGGIRYSAFVVPTFKLGAMAGLGQDLGEETDALDPAWSGEEGKIKLPYYYRWDFRTGMLGDFEHLVRLLEPRKLTGLGLRDMDCAKPGFNTSGVERVGVAEEEIHLLGMEGALQSLDTEYTQWGCDPSIGIKSTENITDIELQLENSKTVIVQWRTPRVSSSRLDYGESSDYGSHIESSEWQTEHEFVLRDLKLGATYHIKITARMENGTVSETPEGAFNMFQLELAQLLNKPNTEDLARDSRQLELTIEATDKIVDINGNASAMGDQVVITWRTTVPRTSRINYWKPDGSQQPPIEKDAMTQEHSITIKKLVPERTYRFKISGTDEAGGTEETQEGEFKILLPVVVPPVYGRWHYGKLKHDRAIVDPVDQSVWLDTLNLDPRHRAAAGLGAEVIRKQQEPLMASAWEQLGAIERANDILRRAQLGRDSSMSGHTRLSHLRQDDFVRVTAAAQKVIIFESEDNKKANLTVASYLRTKTRIPSAAVDPAFRRIAGPRRIIGRRQLRALRIKKGRTVSVTELRKDLIKRLVEGKLEAAGPARQPMGTPRLSEITRRLFNEVPAPPEPAGSGEPPSKGGKAAEAPTGPGLRFDDRLIDSSTVQRILDQQKPFAGIEKLKIAERVAPFVTTALSKWLDVQVEKQKPPTKSEEFLKSVRGKVLAQLDPKTTFVERVKMRFRLAGAIQKRFEPGAKGDPLDQIMWAPEFDYPMYEPLRDLGHNMLLPGVERIPQNTIGLLKTNGRFKEAYLCGNNHEFAGELLWRGYPTDQRGSYFRQFWDVSEYVRKPNEQNELLERWRTEQNYDSIEIMPIEKKLYILAQNLDTALQGLVQKWLLDEGFFRIDDLSDRPRGLIKKLEESGADVLSELYDDEINDAVQHVVIEEGFAEKLKDIKPLTQWRNNPLGANGQRPVEELVLVIRGDLLQRYPNALIYAIDADDETGDPALAEYVPEERQKERIFPIFRANLPTDLSFFGFPFDKEAACGDDDHPGKFFVIEEQPGEPRFGADVPKALADVTELQKWDDLDDLSWSHFGFGINGDDLHYGEYLDNLPDERLSKLGNLKDLWVNASAAMRAKITWQKPVRIAIHAKQMLP